MIRIFLFLDIFICNFMSNKITHYMITYIRFTYNFTTRIKILLKFFLNPKMSGNLRQLANEFAESTNAIRLELNKLTEARMLTSEIQRGNKIYWANTSHLLSDDIRNIVIKSTGIDKVVSNILNKIGDIDLTFIRGDYASGRDTGLILKSQEVCNFIKLSGR